MFRLSRQETLSLLDQPETGMGYQYVQVVVKGMNRQPGIVFNAELLFLERKLPEILRERSFEFLFKEATDSAKMIQEIRFDARARDLGPVAGLPNGAPVFGAEHAGGAMDAPDEPVPRGEVFKRFVAFFHDNRITNDGGLRPGTFATTDRDARGVPTGTQAVDRYALPNPKPAIYLFTFVPPLGTRVQRGKVQPAFGHRGGGDEVYFLSGAPDRTVKSLQRTDRSALDVIPDL